MDQEFAPLHGRRVAVIAHRASLVDGERLIDLLAAEPRVELVAAFAPEHGLSGTVAAGTVVEHDFDEPTGAPIYSLYGESHSPGASVLAEVDVLVYDLQDVGTRFYTCTSTMGLAMQAAAAADVEFMVLDRPNPLGPAALAGPILQPGLNSFIGMYPLPAVYGLTAGELATLIKAEALLPGLETLDLTVVPMQHWGRDMPFAATGLEWVPPSPNLMTLDAALLYPGIALFEATSLSEGRGTEMPFRLVGAPWIDGVALASTVNNLNPPGVWLEPATFTPRPIDGVTSNPRFEGQTLNGVQILVIGGRPVEGFEIGLYLLDAVMDQAEFNGQDRAAVIDQPELFDRLAGSAVVRLALIRNADLDVLLTSFFAEHASFRDRREASLLYDD